MPKNARVPRPSPRRSVDAPAAHANTGHQSDRVEDETNRHVSRDVTRHRALGRAPNAPLRGAGPSSRRPPGGEDPHRTVAVQSNAGPLSRTSSSSGGEPRPGLPVADRRSHDAPRRGIPAWKRTQGGTAAEPRDLRFARSRALVRTPSMATARRRHPASRARFRSDASAGPPVPGVPAADEDQASAGAQSAPTPLLHP
jgi:hypothetical protein